uniref:glycosyltransferase n=1 Tax=Pedobacter sp. TaxID=1411316 RepID=UPI003D7F6CB0
RDTPLAHRTTWLHPTFFKNGFNEQLDQYRHASLNGKSWLAELEQKERDATGIKGLKIGYNRLFGYYIEVTKSFYDLVPLRYTRKQTLANAERFITDELKKLEDTILGAEDGAVKLEYEMFLKIRELLLENIETIRDTANALKTIDAIEALAKAALDNNYVRPSLNEEGRYEILNGRHPVVETSLGSDRFVPNDTHLNEESRVMIITPTDSRHPLKDPDVILVHVTNFNQLMWDNHHLTARVITHGVTMPEYTYTGTLNRGLVVINNLPTRGRLLGLDIFNEVRKHIPLDIVGMGAEAYGIGEVLHPQLPEFMSQYRFLFNPIRYTSLGLAVCEAMALGMPIVGLATTEMAVAIKDGHSGFIHTDINYLIDRMKFLLDDHSAAMTISKHARERAMEKFNINRFTQEWETLFQHVIDGDYASEYTKILP